MRDDGGRLLSEEEARALWERAARLQAEAATGRLQDEAERAGAIGSGDRTPQDGLPMGMVRRAAVEAGIDPTFVDEALVELDTHGPEKRIDRWADAYLGEDTPVAVVQRVLDASPDAVYVALQRVLPRAPFHLVLERIEGGDVRQGGVLVFEVPYAPPTGLMSGAAVELRHYADFREVRVSMRGLPGDAGEGEASRSEVRLSASRLHARRVNFWTGNVFGGIAGVAGGVAGAVLTAGLLAVGGPVELLAVAGAGGAGGLGGVMGTGRLWRRIYRWGQRKGERALGKLLDALELHLRTGGAFSAGATAESQPRDDGSDDLLGLDGLLGD